jgi:hypothetical protein
MPGNSQSLVGVPLPDTRKREQKQTSKVSRLNPEAAPKPQILLYPKERSETPIRCPTGCKDTPKKRFSKPRKQKPGIPS